ncbi:MAG: transposase [Nitrospirae bacterium]|nr:transposase [Nitrospirota bacterium]
MKKRQWSSQQKFRIVLEGLSGQIEISKLCSKYQLSQTQYYQ